MNRNDRIDPNILFHLSAIKGEDAEYFSGRTRLLSRLLNTLGSDEASCVIYGERGVGKTSLAWQCATILNDSNEVFKKGELMSIGNNKKYVCVFHKCQNGIKSVGELLLHILRPSKGEPFSFSNQFKEIYDDNAFDLEIKQNYEFSLFNLVNIGIELTPTLKKPKISRDRTYERITSEHTIKFLFQDVISEMKKRKPDHEIIIFIDEIDQTEIESGLGSFLKNVNNVHFAFIGIADSVSEIIRDHESAGRRLINGDIEVPVLEPDNIRWIYDLAQKKSRNKVHYSRGFVEQVILNSAGFPWIAQNIGFQAIRNVIENGSLNIPIQINTTDFGSAMNNVVRIYEKEKNAKVDLNSFSDSATQKSILEFLWSTTHPSTSDQIRSNINPHSRRFTEEALDRLKTAGILKEKSNRWSYSDPIIRILCRGKLNASNYKN